MIVILESTNNLKQFYSSSDGGICEKVVTYWIVISNGKDLFASNKGKIYSNDFQELPYSSE